MKVTCWVPPERVIVPSSEAVSPVPAVGLPVVSSGGHAVAHAPVHALLAPTSALNRYTVRPVESTRIRPKRLFATRTVAVLVDAAAALLGAVVLATVINLVAGLGSSSGG